MVDILLINIEMVVIIPLCIFIPKSLPYSPSFIYYITCILIKYAIGMRPKETPTNNTTIPRNVVCLSVVQQAYKEIYRQL